MPGIFITGTGTNVGKTVVSAAVMLRFRATTKLRYWKPIQTGIEVDDDTSTVRHLGECTDAEILDHGLRLQRPLSPHLSARLAGIQIDIGTILEEFNAAGHDRQWVVEGAGGVLVPLGNGRLLVDLMSGLDLPVLIVASSGLGTINHTLLTIQALRQRALKVAGVVMVGEPNHENRTAIESYGDVAVIGQMPQFDELKPEALKQWIRLGFDPAALLKEHLG